MGKAIGGDIVEIVVNHATLGTHTFYPKGGEDSTFETGGYRVNDDENGVDGGGNMIKEMVRNRWFWEGTLAWDANDKKTLQTLSSLAESPIDGEYTISHVNGSVWSGNGCPVGAINGNGKAATIAIKFAGGQKMKQIV